MIRAQQLRIDASLTVAQLSEETGVTRKAIARLESTGVAGHYDALVKIANRFGVEPGDLLVPVGPVHTPDSGEAA